MPLTIRLRPTLGDAATRRVECGSDLEGSLIDSGVVDELLIYMALALLGSAAGRVVLLDNLQSLAVRKLFVTADLALIGAYMCLPIRQM